MWKGFAPCPCRPLVHHTSDKTPASPRSGWHQGQGCPGSDSAVPMHPAWPKEEAKPHQATVPLLFAAAGLLPATRPCQAAGGKGDAAAGGFASSLPLLPCARGAAAGPRRALQMDCTAAGIWQAAGCLGTCQRGELSRDRLCSTEPWKSRPPQQRDSRSAPHGETGKREPAQVSALAAPHGDFTQALPLSQSSPRPSFGRRGDEHDHWGVCMQDVYWEDGACPTSLLIPEHVLAATDTSPRS